MSEDNWITIEKSNWLKIQQDLENFDKLKKVYEFIEYKLRTGVYSYSNKILDQAKEMLNETK
jgi:hypothetical protein